MLRVGLRAMGGPGWIAGQQYLHGLLYGNSLLPLAERASLQLYLDFAHHHASDYRAAGSFSGGIHTTDLSTESTYRLYRKMRRTAGIVLRQHRWPGWPRSDLRRLLRRNQTDVLFSGPAIEPDMAIPQVSWIPDFQHVHRPEFFSPEERSRRDRQFARLMAGSDRVVVSNQGSYVDAVRLYPQNQDKLAIVPHTMYLGRSWRGADARQAVHKYRLPDKFLLFPCQLWKHKNHLTVFRAIQLLHERGMEDAVLVCTGAMRDYRFPDHERELRKFLVEHSPEGAVRLLGQLPRHEQVQLMRAAAAIVQASLFEGWSAVVEEGRSLGKVTFASDIPMHREQQTERVHLFPPTSAEGLADLVARHWSRLTPGPHPALEAAAEASYYDRIRNFARRFVAVCRDAVDKTEGLDGWN